MVKKNTCIFISGTGTNLNNLISKSRSYNFPITIKLVICNNKDAYGGSKTGERGWKADNAFFKSVPDFVFKPLKIMKVFKDYIFDLVILIIWVLVITLLLINKSKRIPIV